MIATSEAPILQQYCLENSERVLRSVYPMPLNAENLRRFWEKSRVFKTLFTKEINDDFQKFLELFIIADDDGLPTGSTGLFWVVDDFVGVFYMTEIKPELDALVHYTFFDRRQNGRAELVKAMIRYVFRKYRFQRLSVEIPTYAVQHTFNFVKQIGFTLEGRKRKASFFSNNWFDVECYGMLSTEALNGQQG